MSKPEQRKSVRSSKNAPASAPSQCLGYGLQYTRLTAMLLTAPEGTFCSLEVLDDVSEKNSSGSEHLVQTKSALGANPVSDRAGSLWKTFFNWLNLVAGGLDVAKTTFEIYVSRSAGGEIVDAFSEASSTKNAVAAIEAAKKLLWGEVPTFPLKNNLSFLIANYVNAFFETDVRITSQLIKNFSLKCGSGNAHADIDRIIRGHPVLPSRVDDIAAHMCGWVKRCVDQQLEASLPAVVSRDEFHDKYTAYCRRVDRDIFLKSYASPPTPEESVARLPDVFVQQLDLVGVDFDEKLAAVSDFLMACRDRTLWSQKLEVDETSFDELDDVLTRSWRNYKNIVSIEHGSKSEPDRGKLLFYDCSSHKAELQGMSVPAHFVPGCFHRLADEQTLGWHPDYQTLLKETPKTATA